MRFDTGCPCCRDDFYDYEEWLMSRVSVIEHPLAQHTLTLSRRGGGEPDYKRRLMRALGAMLCCEATRDLELRAVETGSASGALAPALAEGEPALAFLAGADPEFIEGARSVCPSAPAEAANRLAILLDASPDHGHAAAAAIQQLKVSGAKRVRYACALAAPEDIEAVRLAHPEVDVFVIAMDAEPGEQSGGVCAGA